MDKLQQVLSLIPPTKSNAISREKLARLTGLTDRGVRNIIRELREQGEPICSNSETNGYWKTNDITEILHTANEYHKRGRENLKIALKLRRLAQRLSQEGLF